MSNNTQAKSNLIRSAVLLQFVTTKNHCTRHPRMSQTSRWRNGDFDEVYPRCKSLTRPNAECRASVEVCPWNAMEAASWKRRINNLESLNLRENESPQTSACHGTTQALNKKRFSQRERCSVPLGRRSGNTAAKCQGHEIFGKTCAFWEVFLDSSGRTSNLEALWFLWPPWSSTSPHGTKGNMKHHETPEWTHTVHNDYHNEPEKMHLDRHRALVLNTLSWAT